MNAVNICFVNGCHCIDSYQLCIKYVANTIHNVVLNTESKWTFIDLVLCFKKKIYNMPSPLFDDNNKVVVLWAFGIQPNMVLQRTNMGTIGYKKTDSIMPINNVISSDKDTKTVNNNKNNFYKIMGPILVIGQIFGQIPVCGVLGVDSSYLRFKLVSWRVLITFLSITGGTCTVVLCISRLVTDGYSLFGASMLVFYGSTYLTTILFFQLARRWPMLCRYIEKEESRSVSFHFIKDQRSLGSRIIFFSVAFLSLALVEHLLCLISTVTSIYGCTKYTSLMEQFFLSSFPQAFLYTSYAHWKGFLLQIYNTSATFNWIFMDLFIVLISIYITKRFDNLNVCIKSALHRDMSSEFWKITRVDYANIARLVGQVDENINRLILLSFANNLYIICMQLFNSFNTAHHGNELPCWKIFYNGIFTTLYYVVSFSFLVLRFSAVALSASRIYANSRAPLTTLFSVSSESYCTEVQRFIDHITSDVVALSGMKFFYITKGVILTIAGTIVTYELVLVQFNIPAPPIQANITVKDNCGTSGIITDTIRSH